MLHRQLKARHLMMLAFGGAVGTSLFLASGIAIHSAGLVGALVMFGVVGMVVYFLMTSLAEMAVYHPTTGSFSDYGRRYINPAFGFTMGMNYCYGWAVTLAVEAQAAAMVMKFWFPHSNSSLWSLLFLALLFLINVRAVRVFGATEYWLCWIKLFAVVVFIVTGLALAMGLFSTESVLPRLWEGNSFHHGWQGWLVAFMIAGFSFQGTELIGVAAGECEDPEKTIPLATQMTFWRLLIFYLLTLWVIGLIIPVNDPALISDHVVQSPFTIVLKMAGVPWAASLMNGIILVAIFSAGNASMYAATRMLWTMAGKGRVLTKTSQQGVPIVALLVVWLVGCLAVFSSQVGDGRWYVCLVNASALSGFVTWAGIAICHLQFRKKVSLKKLLYRAKFFPCGPYLALLFCGGFVLFQDVQLFMVSHIDWQEVLLTYSLLPVLVITYFLKRKISLI